MVFFGAALISLLSWYLARDPTLALVLLSVTDAVAILPTLRKVYRKPFEDSVTLFSINIARNAIGLFAFQIYTFSAVLYPAKNVFFNALLVVVMLIRRRLHGSYLKV